MGGRASVGCDEDLSEPGADRKVRRATAKAGLAGRHIGCAAAVAAVVQTDSAAAARLGGLGLEREERTEDERERDYHNEYAAGRHRRHGVERRPNRSAMMPDGK